MLTGWVRRKKAGRVFTVGLVCIEDPSLNRSLVLYVEDTASIREIVTGQMPSSRNTPADSISLFAHGGIPVTSLTPASLYLLGTREIVMRMGGRRTLTPLLGVIGALMVGLALIMLGTRC